MAELKTQKSADSVDAFIAGIDGEHKREDSRALIEMMGRITGERPEMWGPSIVGFGDSVASMRPEGKVTRSGSASRPESRL